MSQPVHLRQRAIVSVTGDDAEAFLAGLVTNTVRSADEGKIRYSALLTPQGKIIADFLVFPTEGGFLLDCAASARDDLKRRLSMYKLRSKVEIAIREDLCAVAFSGAADPRSTEAPARSVTSRDTAPSDGSIAAYHAARIAAGLAEQGVDFASGEVFPADINMDALSGVDFAKGCFVGQEVVSRMKRRSTARRRTLVLAFAESAPVVPVPVIAEDFEIGQMTSHSGTLGLARVRIDRLAEAGAAGHAVQVSGQDCQPIWPDWLSADLAIPTKPALD